MKISHEDRQIFIRILNEIYLSSKIRYSNNIIFISNQSNIYEHER